MNSKSLPFMQSMWLRHTLQQRTPIPQVTGLLNATVVDTDHTNPTLPPGTCRISCVQLNADMALGPLPYPGVTAPPAGTSVVVGQLSTRSGNANGLTSLRIVSVIGWQSSSGTAGGLNPFLLMGA